MIGVIATADLAVEDRAKARAKRFERDTQPRRQIARQGIMERYLIRGEVSREQYHDSERLLADWAASGLTPQITGCYGDVMIGTGPPVPGAGPGYARYTAAMRAVGLILSPVLTHVVLHDLPASDWARTARRPPSDGIAALRLALDALGAHYRRGNSRRVIQPVDRLREQQ